MAEAQGRAAVVAEARTWLRTPWAHRQKVKGVGVDCAQFPLAVYQACGLVEAFDTGDYPRDWHIHRDQERFAPIVERFAREITHAEVKPGDLVLCKIGRVFSHGVIVLDWPLGVHAAVNERMVTLCDLSQDVGLIGGPRRYFTLRNW